MAELKECNPFDDSVLAGRYESWYEGPGQAADMLEKDLLRKLLSRFPDASSALEVGCGTGHFTRWLAGWVCALPALMHRRACWRRAFSLRVGRAYRKCLH